MIYLVLAVLVSCSLIFSLKIAQVLGLDAENVTWVNYVVGLGAAIVACVTSSGFGAFGEVANADISTLFTAPSPGNTMLICLVMGAVTGTLYLVNIRFMNRSITANGAGMTTLFNRSGFLLTIVLSVLLWGESLTVIRVGGILLTLVALLAASGIGTGTKLRYPVCLVGMVLCAGIVETNNKVYSTYALDAYKANYQVVVFAAALIACTVVVVGKSRKAGRVFPRIRGKEVLLGICMGLPNAFGNIVQILALERIPATVLFPTLAASALLLSMLLSRFLFKEKFGLRQYAAVGLTCVSLVLVNI